MGGMDKYRPLTPRLLFYFLLFLIIMSYSNTIFSPFILDDFSAFIRNPNLYIDDLSFDSLKKLAHTRFGLARVARGPMDLVLIFNRRRQIRTLVDKHVITAAKRIAVEKQRSRNLYEET